MDYGKKTYVYWNLHKLTFSIMQNQKVVGHSNQLYLSDVEFRVREGGRQKVLKDRVKNVHAFVVGRIFFCPEADSYPMNDPIDEEKLGMWTHRVSYNPYLDSHFVAKKLGEIGMKPVSHASMVGLTNHQGKPLIQSKNNVIISQNYI